MANPSVTTRQTPGGRFLDDGYSTKIAFERDPDVSFWEVTVKLPGFDGGEPINIVTMHNSLWVTKAGRALIEITDITGTCAYDPAVYDQIKTNLMNRNGSVTCHLPDGTTIAMWAYLRLFDPVENADGTFPTANFTIVLTNWDPVNWVEAGPVIASVAGT